MVTVQKDLVMEFGDHSDGAIEFVGLVDGGYIETGYFYGDIKPKNIIVASTQVGCPSKCNFCELGTRPFVRNLSSEEIHDQVHLMLDQARLYGHDVEQVKHKISWAKSGDPLFNSEYVVALEQIADMKFSHKVSTVFPGGKRIQERFKAVADFAASYVSPVQIQVSLISTSEEYRNKAAGIKVASFKDIRNAADYWLRVNPAGRKINLSLILDEHTPVDVKTTLDNFPPELFRFRFRNYVPTKNGSEHGLEKVTKSTYETIFQQFRDKGYDVGTWATPTPIEQKFGLASNVMLRRYDQMVDGKF
jgi:adenine C2-methylase RlmN of 23S rRNA A2503 and tRNA A37